MSPDAESHNIREYIEAKDIIINGRSIGSARIPLEINNSGRISFHLGGVLSQSDHIEAYDAFDEDIKILGPDGRIFEVFASKVSYSHLKEPESIIAVPKRSPLNFIFKDTFSRASALILNPPDLIKREISLEDARGNFFTLNATGQKEQSRLEIKSSSQGNSDKLLSHFWEVYEVLSFAKGQFCGLGNIKAYDDSGELAAEIVGFTRHDEGKPQVNWFDLGIQNSLPEIFSKFSAARTSDLRKRALRQTIDFYRASNASREISIEMAIIAAHSALEAIVNYILEHEAGWSRSLLSERANKFSDKARAAFTFMRLSNDLLENSMELKNVSQSRQDMNGFEIISFFRNKIVHQDLKFAPTGIQLHECWLLMQWLVEALILSSIGYRGEIIDRRVRTGWRGATCKIG